MVSKTAMLDRVRALDWRAVQAGMEPQLLAVRDPRGRSWLHLACGVDVAGKDIAPEDAIRTAQVLLDAGLGLNDPAFTEENFEATPLWFAIARGRNTPLAAWLLERGANPNFCMWAAAYDDNVSAIDLLVRHGAPIDLVAEGDTPLLFAIKWSRFAAARRLLEHGADPDFQDARGRTALHCLLKKSADPAQLAMVASFGARGDLPDADGETAARMLRRKRDPALRALADQLTKKED